MEGGVSADGRRFEKRLPFIIPHGPVCGRWPHQEGQQIVKIDTFYASSKTCSACGHKLETLSLATRNWTCPALRRSS
ncbi:MAG: zinc ribbon domain-containing protein [Sutterella wadsworthensis]|uniref:zinc ribbon domain-containing protein n=1 Tax=Sutterella wadsworthensis TaxID=40545 RepID=UPI0022ABDEAA|nr:zinc ribbon domain-containing protein [Sutterella wadsworthensis]MEE0161487.1 zinc ribbon domain-containing protein [Sutterella wadsworthensis]